MRGHGHVPPKGKLAVGKNSIPHTLLKDGKIELSREVANALSGFNTQRFRLAAVSWLVDNNHPLSEFNSLAFRRLNLWLL